MAEAVARGLSDAGVKTVRTHNVSTSHVSYIIRDVWRYKGLILGSPTYDAGVFPPMESLLRLLSTKRIADRAVGVFGSHGWAGGAVKTLVRFVSDAGLELKTSEWFQLSDDKIFRMEDSKQIIEAAFALKKGELSEPIEGEDNIYLARVVEIKSERQGTLDEVKDRIVAKLKPGVESDVTMEKAALSLEKIKSGETTLAAVAGEAGAEIKTTELLPRMEIAIEEVGYSNTINEKIARLSMEEPWPKEPASVKNNVVIIHLLETANPDMSGFEEVKDEYRTQLLRTKQNEIMEQWLDKLEQGRVTYQERWKTIVQENE